MFSFCRAFIIVVFSFLLSSCAAPVSLPTIKAPTQQTKILNKPPYPFKSKVGHVDLISDKVLMPAAGERNSYGLTVTPELASAYDVYLVGDGNKVLVQLDKVQSKSLLMQWHVSFFRAQTYIMMGLAADAETELQRTMRLEQKYFGNALNSIALRGEARIWIGDYAGARKDFSKVINTIGDWRLPTSYSGPPTNLAALVGLTTAQIRGYVGMAGIAILEGKHNQAKAWAQQAEDRLSDTHYVAFHPLYASSTPTHLDSFYGRALNMSFLATAELATGDVKSSQRHFKQATAYFKAIGYQHGLAVLAALEAYGWLENDNLDKAIIAADKALPIALEMGANDLIWRLGSFRGKALFLSERYDEAEAGFRRAEAAVDTVSGALSSDRAKRRFGIGKDEITYYLSKLDKRNGKLDKLFEDMERGRARSFVDMLAERKLPSNRSAELIKEIWKTDKKIRSANAALMAITPTQRQQAVVNDLYAQRNKLIEQLQGVDPELAEVFVVKTTSLADVQKSLGKDELLVYTTPFRDNDKLTFLIISADRVHLQNTTYTQASLQEDFSLFLDAVQRNRSKRLKRITSAMHESLGIKQWKKASKVYFVASGITHFIPWGAFDTTYPVIVLPNGQWLNRKEIKQSKNLQATVVGDPYYAGTLPQLKGALAEAKVVADLYGARVLSGKKATEKNLRKDLGKGKGILHLATHGVFDAKDPLDSAIILTKGDSAYRLTAANMLEQPLSAQVVILSACETGLGKVAAGDDLLGLSRSLYLGGTRAVLASLWPVQDEGTRLYMQTFHTYLRKDGDIGHAWIKARDMVKAKGYSAAVYAAFTVSGASRIH